MLVSCIYSSKSQQPKVLSRYFTQQGKGLTVFRENTDDQIIPYEQAFGDGGEEKLACIRQKLPAQPGTV